MDKLFLLRYDTEATPGEFPSISGFLEKALQVHRDHEIPVTLFCTGGAIDTRAEEFRNFWREVKSDPLFDIQDHSYSHVGLGYERGKDVETLRDDYLRSFDAHERVFGVRPTGISVCGTGGADGNPLPGFDATEKSRAELDMLADIGVRMINSSLTGIDGSRQFINYASLGHPDIMGFPSAYSDTGWLAGKEYPKAEKYIFSVIQEHAAAGAHMPLMLHDFMTWDYAPDRELTHVVRIVEHARSLGYKLVTHVACLEDESLWK